MFPMFGHKLFTAGLHTICTASSEQRELAPFTTTITTRDSSIVSVRISHLTKKPMLLKP